jgi:carbonic anhydrase/acetyltransferase-like protein (isoleucine patch superfamily)
MALLKPLRGITPTIGKNCFLAETAVIIGDVVVGDDCSIWYGAVLRGDVNSIAIGNRVNIQDGAVLHTLYQRSKVSIGNDVSVGHNAIIHGATVGSNVLVGMGATLLDNAVIPDNTIVAAGALVLSNAQLEPYSVYAGVPAKKVKTLSTEEVQQMIVKNAEGYLMYKEWYLGMES